VVGRMRYGSSTKKVESLDVSADTYVFVTPFE
jgi:hypothetical protein